MAGLIFGCARSMESADEYGTGGLRVYDLSVACRGGEGRARAGREAAVRLREHPPRHGLALLVERGYRARRRSSDDHQNPRVADREGLGGGEGDALLYVSRHPGAADRERR